MSYGELTSEICDCPDPAGSSERNDDGIITHGLIQGGCGLIRRTVVFICALHDDWSVSILVDYVRPYTDYYCDHCRKVMNE